MLLIRQTRSPVILMSRYDLTKPYLREAARFCQHFRNALIREALSSAVVQIVFLMEAKHKSDPDSFLVSDQCAAINYAGLTLPRQALFGCFHSQTGTGGKV